MGKALRFMQASLLLDVDECIMWPFSRLHDGYPCMHREGRTRTTANIVCELKHGLSPTPKHEAAHSCGKGKQGCINHKHLRWATPGENQADRILHGTVNNGEKNGRAALTTDAVRNIFGRFSKGERPADITGDYPHLHPRTIYQITSGYTWNQVTGLERRASK